MFSSFEVSLLLGVFPMKVLYFVSFMILVVIPLIYLKFTKTVSSFIFSSFSFNYQVVLGIFVMIFFMNYFSMLPYSVSFSSLQSTFILSLVMWSSLFFFLMSKNLNSNLSHFLPIGTPSILVGFLVWIEVVSTLARPVALSIRLMANITASHLMMHLSCMGFSTVSFFTGVFLLIPFMLLVFLEMCVAMIQAYVFSMLLVLYTEEGE